MTGVLIGTELSVFIDGNDSVSVRRGATGNVEVLGNGVVVNSVPNIAANTLTGLLVDGSDTNNVIDVSSMTATQFPVLAGITLDGGNGNDQLIGSNSFGESLLGGDGNDTVTGNDGNDTLSGGHGNDSITAGNGNDTVLGGDGRDNVDGGAGNDSLNAGDGDDIVTAGDGDDTVDASHGADNINGGNGNDSMIGGFGNDTVNGGAGNDTIYGGADADSILGGDGNDQLTGNAGFDTIAGEAGDDLLDGGENNDSLDGGDGNDTLNGAAANDTAIGGSGSDIIYGGAGNDSLDGQSGNDTINGNGGDDTVIGGTGSDSLNGSAGNDLVYDADFVPVTLPTLSVNDITIDEGNAGTSNATFTITLSQASAIPVTVSYATVNGTADATDFNSIPTTSVTFAPGEVVKTVSVGILGDVTSELTEYFFLSLSSPGNALLGNPTGICTITNDDGSGIRLLAAAFAGQIYEVDINTAASTLIGSTGQQSIQDFTVGTGNTLYTVLGFPALQLATVNRQTAAVTLVGALTPQPQQTVEGALGFDVTQNAIFASFTGTDPRLYRINPATAANTDLGPLLFNGNPVLGTYNVDAMAFRANELFMVMPTGPDPLLAGALLRIDTATRVITRIGSLGIPAAGGAAGLAYDQTTDTFLYVDGRPTDSVLYRVNPTTGAATRIGNTGVVFMSGLTLDVAQPVPQIGASISDASIVEGTGGANSLNFTVTLDRTPTANVVVDFTTTNGAAQAGLDFTAVTSSITFAPGQTSQTISIPITTDSRAEGNETFFVRLTGATGGTLVDAIGIGTIVDDDVDSASNTMNGGTGNDTIRGGIGDDVINGDEDNDVIDGREGNDLIAGGTGNDSITGGNGDDTVNGSVGNDTLDGGTGNDTYVWDSNTAGTKVLADTQGFQTLQVNGTVNADAITLSNSSSRLKVARGGASITANQTVTRVILNTDAGNDSITVGSLVGVLPLYLEINAGAGNDVISANGVSLGNVRMSARGDADNDTLTGSNSGETLIGGEGVDSILGNSGNDSITGGDGNDTVNAGAGDDSIAGEAGDDSMLGGDGNDVISGGDGNDFGDGQNGNDSVAGGNGDDTSTGSAGNDTLRGDNGDDLVLGGTDNDVLDGGVGNDRMRGHNGNDQIKGGDGDDSIYGDQGVDTIDGGDGNDFIDGSFGADSLPGGSGGILSGGDGDDTIVGGADDDTIIGGDGNDLVNAAGGQDVLYGGDGDDTLSGNGGTDQFNGGQGTNTLDAASPERDNQLLAISVSVQTALNVLAGL